MLLALSNDLPYAVDVENIFLPFLYGETVNADIGKKHGKKKEEFGFSVAAHQDMLIVGSVHNQARGDDTGAVYTFIKIPDDAAVLGGQSPPPVDAAVLGGGENHK